MEGFIGKVLYKSQALTALIHQPTVILWTTDLDSNGYQRDLDKVLDTCIQNLSPLQYARNCAKTFLADWLIETCINKHYHGYPRQTTNGLDEVNYLLKTCLQGFSAGPATAVALWSTPYLDPLFYDQKKPPIYIYVLEPDKQLHKTPWQCCQLKLHCMYATKFYNSTYNSTSVNRQHLSPNEIQ